MNIIRLTCPNCKSHISVKDVPGIYAKMLTCPICRFSAKVSIFHAGDLNSKAQGHNESDTQIVESNNAPKNSDIGQIRVRQTGQVFSLKIGSQVLGRLAETSSADFKIGNSHYKDEYMSRQHVKIIVVNSNGGIQHQLEEIGSTNIIKLNGSEIKRGDKIILKFGDIITLGNTEVVLEKTSTESTIVL